MKAATRALFVLAVLSICGCETVSNEEQARRANQRQTDYTAEINRRRKEAEDNERSKSEPDFFDQLIWGSPSPEKTPPRELTEEELKPRR